MFLFHMLMKVDRNLNIIKQHWTNGSDTELHSIIQQQKLILWLMNNKKKSTHSWPLFFLNNILPLKYLFLYSTLTQYHDMPQHNSFKCNANQFTKIQIHCEIFAMSILFSECSPSFFNKLKVYIRNHILKIQVFVR